MGAIMKKVYVGILICLVIVIVSAGCGKKYMQEADDTDWVAGNGTKYYRCTVMLRQ